MTRLTLDLGDHDVFARSTGVIGGNEEESHQPGLHTQWSDVSSKGYGLPRVLRRNLLLCMHHSHANPCFKLFAAKGEGPSRSSHMQVTHYLCQFSFPLEMGGLMLFESFFFFSRDVARCQCEFSELNCDLKIYTLMYILVVFLTPRRLTLYPFWIGVIGWKPPFLLGSLLCRT